MLEISLSGLINFLLGIFSGFILFTLVYVYLLVRGKNLDLETVNKPVESVDEDSLKTLILEKQQAFKKLYKKREESYGKLIFDFSYELIEDISSYHYPESKHPMLELSIDEMLELNHYITDRLKQVLDQPLLKNTRTIRVTKIVELFEKKKRLEQTKLAKVAKNKSVNRAVKVTLGAVNVFNPAYWFRKIVIHKSLDFVSKRIALLTLAVVGEETAKVYSKKLFDKEVELDLVDKELEALESGDEDDEDNS